MMLTDKEIAVLADLFDRGSPHLTNPTARALHRLVDPLTPLLVKWRPDIAGRTRSRLLRRVHLEQCPYWDWDQDVWRDLANAELRSSSKLLRRWWQSPMSSRATAPCTVTSGCPCAGPPDWLSARPP